MDLGSAVAVGADVWKAAVATGVSVLVGARGGSEVCGTCLGAPPVGVGTGVGDCAVAKVGVMVGAVLSATSWSAVTQAAPNAMVSPIERIKRKPVHEAS